MRELRKAVMEEFNAMIQDLVEEIKDAEKSGEGLDITNLFSKQSEHYKELMLKFEDAEKRFHANPKKFIGG